ncbi:ExbD/TolR family protein [Synoicihabitans lomoniglobus]|uniref:Biopolymer transporter ExbD n=1 Tax=Synoicihabitans lomoniglobus TaxID=2909285 RepID=A0AAE9ZVA0_9BACT|nr:biopolymer transporter ExbD [Opitutaceae bacterium LMO-M01]WED64031.1 biopolymer transporter ExbD [Opitutaceae bacterium LMO-M01]
MMKTTRSDSRYNAVTIDLAPMIDCVFILLIFFIVTSVFVEDPGIEVERPDTRGEAITDRNALLIAISAEDAVFFDGQQVRIDQVASVLRQASFSDDATVIIRADRRSSHGIFASVYAEAKRAGLEHVQFATSRLGSGN